MSERMYSRRAEVDHASTPKDDNPIDRERVDPDEQSNVAPFGKTELSVSTATDNPQWDDFLRRVGRGHHLQTSLWAQAKSTLNWQGIRVVATADQRIIGGAQILHRSLMPTVRVAYITKGPVVEQGYPELVKLIIQKSLEVCRALHARIVVVQPPNNDRELVSLLPELGFESTTLELAPSASILIDLSLPTEELMKKMRRQTRQNINRSERSGIVVREGEEKDIEVFYRCHLETSKRQGFVPYPMEYFLRMWQVFSPHDSIKLFVAEHSRTPISSLLVVPFGNTVVPKIFGWSGLFPEKRPNEAVFWGAILWAKAHGYGFFDLEGIDRDGATALLRGESLPEPLRHSPDFFKLGFGGEVLLYPAAYRKASGPLLRWISRRADPKIGGNDLPSRILDYIRKR